MRPIARSTRFACAETCTNASASRCLVASAGSFRFCPRFLPRRVSGLLVCVCFVFALTRADEIGLCRVGDAWKFLPVSPGAAAVATNWNELSFDDAAWASGASGFSSGYAANEATPLPLQAVDYGTILFRRPFFVSEPAAIKWLTLRIDYVDGFVAWLNGREIARRNVSGAPGVPLLENQLASTFHLRGSVEEINVSEFCPVLQKGTNLLAVQLLGARASSIGLCLSAELLANFNRGPILQNMSSNQVQIVWKTPIAAESKVEYGMGATFDQSVLDTNLVTTHVVTLTNLSPGSDYAYRVSSVANGDLGQSELSRFRTFKTEGPVRFVVFGDGGWNAAPQYQIASVMQRLEPDFVLEVGDTVYPSFTSALVDLRCFSVYGKQMRQTPYFFAIGNHDLYSGVASYLDAFHLPTNSVPLSAHNMAQTSPEHYYSFDHGDVHFTVLYIPFLYQYKLTAGDPQFNWLTNDLASTSKPWKIVLFHVPFFSSSAHRFDDSDYNGAYDRLELKNLLLPVLARYGVQLVVCGHEHGYERFIPAEGVHCITTAGGGGGLYGFSELDSASALFWTRHNCLRVTVDGSSLKAEAFGTQGDLFDQVFIQRASPPPKKYQAAWHSPVIETVPADDQDGNIFGQSFDFAGEAIPAIAGQFSNLGIARVDNDETNLYVGFEGVMINSDNNLFVFIESPGRPGVNSLAQIGNGIVDPQGQGADGLDFLANLSFTNFSPIVGCILGDEFADRQDRSFARPSLSLKTGQGIFCLDTSLSDLPGTRMQQFHLSPQVAGMLAEQNANFIEISIPLAELALHPGDTIRLAAVVGGSGWNLKERSRALDSGYLGRSFSGAHEPIATIEGVEVQLARDPESDADGDGLTLAEEIELGTNPENADSDNDGLPDGWEVAHGLEPLSTEGNDGRDGDPDGDRCSNLHEYLAGTDPRNANSVLKILLETTGTRRVRLTWKTMPGLQYFLQSTRASQMHFQDVPGVEFAPSLTATNQFFEVDLPALEGFREFYRIRLER